MKTGSWSEYLGPRGMRMENGESSKMRNFIACTVHLIFSGWRLRWVGHVARIEEGRSAFKMLTGKPTAKRHLGRPRHTVYGRVILDWILKK